jgi:hypothetical protein
MIIHLQFGFSQFIIFREDLWNFSQSEHIVGPGSHPEYPNGTKNRNFVEDHPRNFPAKFGSNWPSGFGEAAWNVKSLQTTDFWSRWTKNQSLNQTDVLPVQDGGTPSQTPLLLHVRELEPPVMENPLSHWYVITVLGRYTADDCVNDPLPTRSGMGQLITEIIYWLKNNDFNFEH